MTAGSALKSVIQLAGWAAAKRPTISATTPTSAAPIHDARSAQTNAENFVRKAPLQARCLEHGPHDVAPGPYRASEKRNRARVIEQHSKRSSRNAQARKR